MKRNQAGQILAFQMNKLSDGTNADGLTGISAKVEIDGGGEANGLGSIVATSRGGYKYLWPQGETDGYHVAVSFYHPQAITQRFNIYTDDGSVGTELAKVIKSGETARHVQGTVHTEEDVEATITRV